jgi:hypothetical protein
VGSRAIAASLFTVAVLATGCGTKEEPTSGAAPTATANGAGTLVAAGFGQHGEYAWVTSLVHNNSTKVGQTVTVLFNAKDQAGTLLKSVDQVEAFSRVGQDLAVGTQLTLSVGAKIATVDTTLLVEDKGVFSAEPFPELGTTPVTLGTDPYGNVTANFELSNPTGKPVMDPRIGIICYDATNRIIGGGSEYPDVVPPSGRIAVQAHTLTSGIPASCKVFPGAP